MGRVDRILAGRREVEQTLETLGGVRLHRDPLGGGGAVTQHRNGAFRNLDQDIQLLARAGRVGHHHLGAVDQARHELLGHELVDLLAILDLVAIAVPEVTLADQEGRALLGHGGFPDLAMERDGIARRRELELRFLDLGLVLTRLEREVEDREGEEHLVDIA
ncbi:MAG: hypothetical protein GWO24_35395 [Akkermansiaceae bacterium]|nr:hypothetical protein [Akkermansiaceae bacterium]